MHDLAETLDELRIQAGSNTRFDLTALPALRVLACDWKQVRDTIGKVTGIEDLYLASYAPSDLTPIAHLSGLRSLRMKERPAVRSLDGLEALPWLSQLGIFLSPLEDLSALAALNPPVLAELQLESCRRVVSLDDVRRLVGLRYLNVSECGDIDSLAPIAELRNLERLYLYGSTKILDGDLSPLLGLTRLHDLRLMNRRHYAPQAREVKVQLGIRD